MRHTLLLAALAGLSLAGCAGMSESECQYSDWRAVGYEDGARGRGAEEFGRHRKSCAEHGVAADFAAWQSGREAGLKEYCQPTRGFDEGARGGAYRGVCPAELEPRFLEAWHDGRTLWDLESKLRQTTDRIEANEARIRAIDLDLADRATTVLGGTATREERARIMVETKQLAEERGRLAGEIPDLEAKRAIVEKQLADARQEILARR